ncbi:MAG: type III-B CRISPR module-associated protein Cmr5 [Ignavibacteria bacterium]|nr:type III-B CRISPR module-associated protein Cmr5 [Ignavibacteria bacterium]
MNGQSDLRKLEQGRAEFAFKCASEGKQIRSKYQIDNFFYKDDKYASYVKKIPAMILSNGLGQTLAFIFSKRKKTSENNAPGTENNPKNAYDLIYKHLTDYLKSNTVARINMPHDQNDLLEWVISLDSKNYRFITQELIAFLSWVKRFAEGLTEEEDT